MLADGDARLTRITSVFPSTTAAALSSIHTGRTPAEHGYLGYSVWLDAGPEVTDLLGARDVVTGASRPTRSGPPAIFSGLTARGVTCRVVNSAAIADSALSAWHFAGAEYRRWYSANTLPSLLADAAATVAPTYIWAYWPAHDHVCHVYGPASREAADELAAFDLVLARVIGRLPRDGRTLLLLSGDHGQQTLDPARAVFLDDIVSRPTAGERTALYARAEPGLAARLGDLAEVVEMDRLWAEGWFGGPPADPAYRLRTGDLLACPRDGRQCVWRATRLLYRGSHGGWSADEMLVPLIALRV